MKYLAIISLVCWSINASAASFGPYQADPNTLHLWHLDDAASPAVDTIGNSIPLTLTAAVPAEAGYLKPAFTGFGTSVQISDPVRRRNTLQAVTQPVSQASLQGADGAFTYETMVNFTATNSPQTFLAMRNSTGQILWQLSYNGNAGLHDLSFFKVHGGQTFSAEVPLAGPNALNLNDWFHLAVTYDGNAGAANNFNMYWTKVDPSLQEASLLTSGSILADLPGNTNLFFTIGNNLTDDFNPALVVDENSVRGQLDEVRISSIARSAENFLFIPEPSTMMLLVTGGFILRRRWQRK